MNSDISYILRVVLNFLVVGIIIYIVARLFIFLLPIIIVLIIAYYIYKIYLETKTKIKENNNDKKDKVMDAEIISEKFDK